MNGSEMISKVFKVKKLSSKSTQSEDLAYWLTQTPEKRIGAVELLRIQFHENTARLQRFAKVTKRKLNNLNEP
jgi:hypothetical protein